MIPSHLLVSWALTASLSYAILIIDTQCNSRFPADWSFDISVVQKKQARNRSAVRLTPRSCINMTELGSPLRYLWHRHILLISTTQPKADSHPMQVLTELIWNRLIKEFRFGSLSWFRKVMVDQICTHPGKVSWSHYPEQATLLHVQVDYVSPQTHELALTTLPTKTLKWKTTFLSFENVNDDFISKFFNENSL